MSVPRIGCRVRMRPRIIPNYVGHYGAIDKDDVFIVEAMDNARKRGTVYLKPEKMGGGTGDRLIPVWRGDVKAFPRCGICNGEGHTTSRHTKAHDTPAMTKDTAR